MSKHGWKRYKLSQIMDIIGGGTPKTSVREYWGGSIPWLSVVDFCGSNRRVYKTEKTITEKGLQESSTKILKKGQVIISARGTVGEIAQLGCDMAFNQSCYGLDGKRDIVGNDFLYYLLKISVADLKQNTHGAVFDTITRQTFDCIDVNVPPLLTQKQIAKNLGDLDEKIELNHQMNKMLEAIAQAIFKKWFVDFEFPGHEKTKFVNGLPERWREGVLDDFVTFVVDNRGKTPPVVERSEGAYPLIEVNALINSPIAAQSHFAKKFVDEETYNTWFRKGHPKRGDILFSTVGSIGEIALSFNEKLCIAQNLIALRTNTKGIFLYLTLKAVKEDLMALDISSVQPSIKVPHLLKYKIMHPSEDAIQEFEIAVEPLINIVFNNEEENRKLSQLRDFLLPKLMAGEVAA